MGISLNPASIWFDYIRRKNIKRQKVAEYLSEVSRIAHRLCLKWEEVIREIEENNEYIKKEKDYTRSPISPFYNALYHSTLTEHFKYISSVMGDDFNAEMEPFIIHISRLLEQRSITRSSINEYISKASSNVVFAQENEALDIERLQNFVLAMRKEASAIDVKARVFATKYGT